MLRIGVGNLLEMERSQMRLVSIVRASISAFFVVSHLGCSLKTEVWGRKGAPEGASSVRELPDFIAGERVITTAGTPGFEVQAVVGELATKVKSLDGQWEIEGVFFE